MYLKFSTVDFDKENTMFGSSPNGRYLWCAYSNDPQNEEEEKQPVLKIFDLLLDKNDGGSILLMEVDKVDLVERCGYEIMAFTFTWDTNSVEFFLDNDRDLAIVLKLKDEVKIFFGDHDVSEEANRGEHLKPEKAEFFFSAGTVLWYSANTIEYVLYRKGSAEYRKVAIELEGD